MAAGTRSFSVQAMIRGYHVYKAIWEATIDGELLLCEIEVGNIHDTFAVAVKKSGVIVGHCPRKISSVCSIFIRRGGSIHCQVTGNRQFSGDRLGGTVRFTFPSTKRSATRFAK